MSSLYRYLFYPRMIDHGSDYEKIHLRLEFKKGPLQDVLVFVKAIWSEYHMLFVGHILGKL